MFTLLLLVLVLLAAGLAWPTVYILIPKAILALAEKDTWWSPFRNLPPPGEMYFILRGSRAGPFDRILESVPDYKYEEEGHRFTKLKKAEIEDELNSISFLQSIGVAWVGFFRYLLMRETVHMRYVQTSDKGEWGLVSKVRPGPSVFFRWNMATLVEAAEIEGNLAVDAVIVYTAQLTDPVKALFFTGGWEKQVAAAIQSRFRRYASNETFEDLRSEQKKEGDKQAVSTQIINLNKVGPDERNENGLLKLFGVEIVDARFVKVDIVGNVEARQSIQLLEIAKRKAQAAREEGAGERDRQLALAEGKRAMVEAYLRHPDGAQIAMADAIAEAKPSVIGAGVLVSADPARPRVTEK